MRTYERTHPWITFQLDLRRASPRLWLLLGQAQAKCEQIAGVPLQPRVAEQMHKLFLAKGALATTAIEGNTLTEAEVLKHLEGKLELPPSKEYLGQEVENIIQACNLIAERVLIHRSGDLCSEDVKTYNSRVLEDLPLEEDVIPGEIRQHSVVVGRYRCAPAEDCEYLLEKLCNWINGDFEAPRGHELAFGIVKAIVAHVYIAWTHPFADGNGRTARLMEFEILLSVGIPTAAAHLLSNHYNQTRTEYYRYLDHARSDDGLLSFVEYALQGFVDGLNEQISLIEVQQLNVHWINYIHDRFSDKVNPPGIRRRHLVLDLSRKEEVVPISEIRHISPRVAEHYAPLTVRTIRRDIRVLESMGLVERTLQGIRARSEVMRAFLPRTRPED